MTELGGPDFGCLDDACLNFARPDASVLPVAFMNVALHQQAISILQVSLCGCCQWLLVQSAPKDALQADEKPALPDPSVLSDWQISRVLSTL